MTARELRHEVRHLLQAAGEQVGEASIPVQRSLYLAFESTAGLPGLTQEELLGFTEVTKVRVLTASRVARAEAKKAGEAGAGDLAEAINAGRGLIKQAVDKAAELADLTADRDVEAHRAEKVAAGEASADAPEDGFTAEFGIEDPDAS